MNMVEEKTALCVPGNHEMKLLSKLQGADVPPTHGFDITAGQMENEPREFAERVKIFLEGLVSHYILDGGNLVVAHAGLKEKLQGRASGRVRSFCLYGETTGETDEFGLPVLSNWADEYRGRPMVVYGHTPSMDVQKANNTYCIDTGCVFGGKLTSLRYPENELAQVAARMEYYVPSKPLQSETEERGETLDIKDVLGKRRISTGIYRDISIPEENSAAALEIMSRFSADPRWLIYLPPTMSPCETSHLEDYLEYPLEAMNYYKKRGTERVVCEEKHMGSRAIVVLCRDAGAAKCRFGIDDGSIGLIYTRTGRHFFDVANSDKEVEILRRLRDVLETTGFWKEFSTDWVCLDTELMPWSAKAGYLLAEQYAPVGRAGLGGLDSAISVLERAAEVQTQTWAVGEKASGQNMDLTDILKSHTQRRESLGLYIDAYHRYCWPVKSVDDYRVAPFHVLATENRVWSDCDHLTHLEIIARYMTGVDSIFMATNHVSVILADNASVEAGVDWWNNLTASGGEGMVVKPLDFIPRFRGELIQPAVKCRGREYLRVVYGPEYTSPDHLKRLKKRSLGKKNRLALSEFSLGVESLERFVKRDPLYRVHECVFAILAMEIEPVDPRL
jgi:protein phosphatase